MEKQAMRFLNTLGNKFFNMAFTWLLDQRFKDTLCGTKVLYRSDYERDRRGRSYFGDFDPFGGLRPDLRRCETRSEDRGDPDPVQGEDVRYDADLALPPRLAAAADVSVRPAPDKVRMTPDRRKEGLRSGGIMSSWAPIRCR